MTAKIFINLLYSFEAPGTASRRLKKLTSLNNTTLNKRIQKALATWMFRILSLFDFQKIYCGKVVKYQASVFSVFMDLSGTAEYGSNN